MNAVATALYLTGFAMLGAFLATYPSGVPTTRFGRGFVRATFVVPAVFGVLGQLVSTPVVLISPRRTSHHAAARRASHW